MIVGCWPRIRVYVASGHHFMCIGLLVHMFLVWRCGSSANHRQLASPTRSHSCAIAGLQARTRNPGIQAVLPSAQRDNRASSSRSRGAHDAPRRCFPPSTACVDGIQSSDQLPAGARVVHAIMLWAAQLVRGARNTSGSELPSMPQQVWFGAPW